MGGFIKDFRSELKSDIWMMPPLYHRVWQYLKYKVNHSANKIPMEDGNFFSIEPGQHLTSVRSIAQGVGYYEGLVWKEPNPKTISSILSWLEKQEMIKIDRGRGNRQYTLVTVLNWALYQSENGRGNSKGTASGEGREQQADIKKNEEEGFKNEKESLTTTTDEFGKVARMFEANICMLSPMQYESFEMWFNDFNGNAEILEEAIRTAADRNKKSYGFAEYLLKEWANNKLTTLDQVRSHERNKFGSKVHKFEPQQPKKDDYNYDYGF